MSSRSAYDGTQRKIVLAFDVGTTYSGISYSILDPGQMPGIKGVTRFPAQEQITGASKIPTIIYYDPQGKARAIGAEATRDGVFEAAEDGGWFKAEWFKLHLRSKVGEGKTISHQVPPLPPNKTVVDVFADFLKYMLTCAAKYIQDTHPNGVALWEAHSDSIHFVLSHPNGWEGKEQSQMRKAAVKAGLVPDTLKGHERVSFVTEGEASLHFVIENGVLSQTTKGEGVVVVDAGGGTVDISTYANRGEDTGRRRFEEIAIPQCHFFGSVFVTIAARVFLEISRTQGALQPTNNPPLNPPPHNIMKFTLLSIVLLVPAISTLVVGQADIDYVDDILSRDVFEDYVAAYSRSDEGSELEDLFQRSQCFRDCIARGETYRKCGRECYHQPY